MKDISNAPVAKFELSEGKLPSFDLFEGLGVFSRFRPAHLCAFQSAALSLAPQVELQQDVVEDLVQRQLDVRPSAPTREVRQDKFIKLLKVQTRWNALPVLAFRHFDCQSRRILPDAPDMAQTQCSCGLTDNSVFGKTRNQL